MATTTIRHVILMPEDISESRASFFQGFSQVLLKNYLEIFSAISIFPHDILEIYLDEDKYVWSKKMGSSLDVYQIREDLLDERHFDFDGEFNVLWSTALTLNSAVRLVKKFKYSPIHISTSKSEEAVFIKNLSNEKVSTILTDLLGRIISSHPETKFTNPLKALIDSKSPIRTTRPIPFEVLGHNCTRPLIKTLSAAGYEAVSLRPISADKSIDQHISGITSLSKFIDDRVEQADVINLHVKNDAIVYCPSIYSYLYKSNSNFWNGLYRKLTKPERVFLKGVIIRNKGYSNISIEVDDENFNPYDDEIISNLLHERQLELRLFTEIISIMAANQFCPSIRFPNSVMLHHDRLKNIALLIKSTKKQSIKKLNNKLISYSDTLKNDVGDEILKCAIDGRKKLLAVCDFPIEWISLNGFPIMFTHEISRIPSTPGNLFSQQALSGQRITIPCETFSDILVVRSFSDSDPIKDHLKIAIDHFAESGSYNNINIHIVDVESEEELIETLNNFTGVLVVFDCHGDHGGETSNGWLNIGKEQMDVWNLANKCNIPPIIVLSACSTHPVDGSHASVANGFFKCGAMSVIGTYAPVGAVHAGIFVARLLYRISEFVPIIAAHRPITWREVVSGFFRMSYATDLLRGLRDEQKIITDKQYEKIHTKANFIINSFHPDWTAEFLKVVKDEANIPINEIEKIIKDKYQFVETMIFSQLGRPENIIIDNSDA